MNNLKGRLRRDRKTISAMIAIYCRDTHGAGPASCAECAGLLAYASERLVQCPYGAGKPTCLNCKVHCYRADMRQRVRDVMRYAGPRMMLRHPILTLLHLYWESRRAAPDAAKHRAA